MFVMKVKYCKCDRRNLLGRSVLVYHLARFCKMSDEIRVMRFLHFCKITQVVGKNPQCYIDGYAINFVAKSIIF